MQTKQSYSDITLISEIIRLLQVADLKNCKDKNVLFAKGGQSFNLKKLRVKFLYSKYLKNDKKGY